MDTCAHKSLTNIFIGAIYFMLGNLDPAVRSRLDVIYLVSLFRAELLERYSHNRTISFGHQKVV